MSTTTYASCTTTPAEIAAASADSGEIRHIECPDRESAERWEMDLLCLLDESDSACPAVGPIEVWGALDGYPVRIHIVHG